MRTTPLLLLTLSLLSCRDSPQTPLSMAAVRGDQVALERLLTAGASASQRDEAGLDALTWAARAGKSEAIVTLVRHGADVNGFDGRNHWTPLLHAVHKQEYVAASKLLELGANPDRGDLENSITPLIMASGYGDVRMMTLLLHGKASPRKQSADGSSPLDAAISGATDIDDFTFGRCQADAVKTILAFDPHAPHSSHKALKPCRAVAALLGRA